MLRLTKDLATATAQGDLDRALEILEERRRTLKGFSWPEKADPDFWEKVRALRDLEKEVLAFCRTWREVVEKRLRSLNTGHFLSGRGAVYRCEQVRQFSVFGFR
jgi:hypothetical protein